MNPKTCCQLISVIVGRKAAVLKWLAQAYSPQFDEATRSHAVTAISKMPNECFLTTEEKRCKTIRTRIRISDLSSALNYIISECCLPKKTPKKGGVHSETCHSRSLFQKRRYKKEPRHPRYHPADRLERMLKLINTYGQKQTKDYGMDDTEYDTYARFIVRLDQVMDTTDLLHNLICKVQTARSERTDAHAINKDVDKASVEPNQELASLIVNLTAGFATFL